MKSYFSEILCRIRRFLIVSPGRVEGKLCGPRSYLATNMNGTVAVRYLLLRISRQSNRRAAPPGGEKSLEMIETNRCFKIVYDHEATEIFCVLNAIFLYICQACTVCNSYLT